MSPIPLGILAVAGKLADTSDLELISTQFITGNTASVTFSSIPQTYRHLQIRMVTQGTGGYSNINSNLRLNGDTGANYSYHFLQGNGSSATSSNAWPSTGGFYVAPGSSDYVSAALFSSQIIDILDYSQTSKYKTARTLGGLVDSTKLIHFVSGNWRSTAAITTIAINGIATNYKAGSRFSLYGIKG